MTNKFVIFSMPYQWTAKLTQLNRNKSRLRLSSAKKFGTLHENSVNPDQTAPIGSLIWVHSVCFDTLTS